MKLWQLGISGLRIRGLKPGERTDRVSTRQTEKGRRLDIKLGKGISPPTGDHNLLLGFHFRSEPAADDHPAIISLSLEPIDHDRQFETWWYDGDVSFTESGLTRIAECQDYTVVTLQKKEPESGDFRAFTYQAYRDLLLAVRSTQHTRVVKMWNYFDGINRGDNDEEKYRQFSIGRAEAFSDMGIRDEKAPTGTAIGTLHGRDFSLIALASKHNFQSAENPRQMSAFHYPRRYGPRSPMFSRGGIVSSDNHDLFLISGTAAIVGHESMSPYDTHLQTNETFKNLDLLCEAVSNLDPDGPPLILDEESVLRVYLRNTDDHEFVSKRLDKALGKCSHKVAFLHASICRRELMVEIDGVKVM